MIFNEAFYLNFSAQEAWDFFTDLPQPILTIPGLSQIRQAGPSQFVGLLKAQLGPLAYHFKGHMEIVQIDHHKHEVVIKGRASDNELGGHFEAVAHARTFHAGANRAKIVMEVQLLGLGGLLGKAGNWLLKPKARSVVEQYAQQVSRELGRRRMLRALEEPMPALEAATGS
ncbi:MAG TPA: SRPBCC domain-containing protein [Chloroflexia bacterium]|nr:SRPBCC domain-containing protein [Chloroflexia bacterium]